MCGIVGMAGDIFAGEKRMFRTLLILDMLRGLDSTGVCVVARGPYPKKGVVAPKFEVEVDKEVGGASNLWDFSNEVFDWQGTVKRMSPRVLIGHNRSATIGKVTKEFAHPHVHGKITGVHNGTLIDYKRSFDSNLASDSMAIFEAIDKRGIEDVWRSLRGAASLVWWDSKNDTLNFIRNDERPMYIGESEDRKTIFWASEYWMVMTAAARENVKLHKYNDGNHCCSLAPNNHLMFDVEHKIECVESRVLTPWSKFWEWGEKKEGEVECLGCGKFVDKKDIDQELAKETNEQLCKTCAEDPVITGMIKRFGTIW